jgi:hypothetical protein
VAEAEAAVLLQSEAEAVVAELDFTVLAQMAQAVLDHASLTVAVEVALAALTATAVMAEAVLEDAMVEAEAVVITVAEPLEAMVQAARFVLSGVLVGLVEHLRSHRQT